MVAERCESPLIASERNFEFAHFRSGLYFRNREEIGGNIYEIRFRRVLEPALINNGEQVDAYASADFSESHDRLIARISEFLPGEISKAQC